MSRPGCTAGRGSPTASGPNSAHASNRSRSTTRTSPQNDGGVRREISSFDHLDDHLTESVEPLADTRTGLPHALQWLARRRLDGAARALQ